MGLFNKSAQLLPVKVSKNEDKMVPTISDPQLLAQKRSELKELVNNKLRKLILLKI